MDRLKCIPLPGGEEGGLEIEDAVDQVRGERAARPQEQGQEPFAIAERWGVQGKALGEDEESWLVGMGLHGWLRVCVGGACGSAARFWGATDHRALGAHGMEQHRWGLKASRSIGESKCIQLEFNGQFDRSSATN